MKKGMYVFLIPILLFSIVGVISLKAKTHKEKVEPVAEGIKWITIEQAEQLSKSNPKKIMVDLYTSWCGWCKVLDEKTYSDPKVYNYINEHFYAVKFDAERKDDVVFQGKTYSFNPSLARNGCHQLAFDWGNTNSKIGYPTIVYLDENFVKLESDPGYKEVPAMIQKIKFYGSGSYKTMNWQQYQQSGN
ncbi:MAG: DUF255 domain-containing protein [Chitinophagales bacterium]|nr:DUF255 domain-containing protein [Chitinophagales bacterium]